MSAPSGRPALVAAILLGGDVLVLQLGVLVGALVRAHLVTWFPIGIGAEVFLGANAVLVVLPIGYWLANLYPGYGQTGVERLRARVKVTALLFATLLLFDHLAQSGQWSRGILVTAALFSLVAIPIWDAAARHVLIRHRLWGMPVAVWGQPERRATVVRSLIDHPTIGWNPVFEGDWPDASAPPLPGVSLAILVSPANGTAAVPPVTDRLPYARVVLVPAVDEVQSLWVSVRDMGTHLGLEMRRNLLSTRNRMMKRCLDLAVAGVAGILCAPVVLAAGLAVKIASPGPMFFVQRRAGRNGVPFSMLKLRTMAVDADKRLEAAIAESPETAAEWRNSMKLRHDPRIVPVVGRFLRRFSIDELPQFWNVLRGDMSVVGPRPLPAYHVEALDPVLCDLRQQVYPGITGLSQISGRSSRSIEEQQRLDGYYVRNWSPWLDLHILACTVVEVLRGEGAW
ncbi:MAG: exopolysaccharide biosynthesis polyprenyl glycosylphosphotransferase [Alphaproteobacteria bacterium]